MDLNETQNQTNCFVKMKQKTHSKSNFMKNLLPRSGSYDINNNNIETNNTNCEDSLNFTESLVDNSLPNSKKVFRSTQSIIKLFTNNRAENYDSDFYETCKQRRRSFYKFQKKWTLMGMPLLYLTYFSAIYTFVSL